MRKAVQAVCPAWLVDDVEDLTQSAMIRIMNLVEKSEGTGRFNASYLKKVAYTTLVDEIRRRRRKAEVPLPDEGEGEGPGPSSDLAGPDRRAAAGQIGQGIRDCLRALLDDRRRAVTLYLHGHSVKETAEILNWGAKRAENLVFRGLADLRDCLRSKGLEP